MEISIIIPTLNRSRLLKQTLRGIEDAIGNTDGVEIIVVDNGSTDETKTVVRNFINQHASMCIRYYIDETPGLLSGRHRGASEAKGRVLAYLDDDVILAEKWLKSLTECFQQSDVVLVGGPSSPIFEANPPDWLEDMWMDFEGGRHCGHLSLIDQGSKIKNCDPCYVWGLNFAIRKETLHECGGFHPDCIPSQLMRYQGDGETGLGLKIKERGLQCIYHPDVSVEHVIPQCRLIPEAFERRAYYQGVCDSFTQIRKKQSAECKIRQNPVRKAYRGIRYKVERGRILRNPTADGIKLLMKRAYGSGYTFHQTEVRKDPLLMEWVLKPNYFDYRLPEGWQKFA
jgi:glycosyltransferase involved in cell wall biosynthesis